MVTHEPDVARHAKRIIRMKDGRVLSDMSSDQDGATGATQPEPVLDATLAYAARGV